MRNSILVLSVFLLISGVLFTSCEKQEQPIRLPIGDTGVAQVTIDMGGADRPDQIFYSLTNKQVVFSSEINSWDLAFETTPAGYHVFINGGKQMGVYNTHTNNIAEITTDPKLKNNQWKFDANSLLPDSTAIGDWRNNGEVYLVKTLKFTGVNADGVKAYEPCIKKIVIANVTDNEYIMYFGDLQNKETKRINLKKDPSRNYTYFSFDKEDILEIEPAKETWDIVFTRYQNIYYDMDNLNYSVTGVLLNPYKTTAATDTKIGFVNIKLSSITDMTFSNFRTVIGYDWKTYDLANSKYIISKTRSYVVKTNDDRYIKMHFLSFDKDGVYGYPSMEIQELY